MKQESNNIMTRNKLLTKLYQTDDEGERFSIPHQRNLENLARLGIRACLIIEQRHPTPAEIAQFIRTVYKHYPYGDVDKAFKRLHTPNKQ